MKNYSGFFFVGIFLIILPAFSEAQLLKKIGKSVKQIATETIGPGDKNEKNPENNEPAGNQNANRSSKAFNYESHGINVIPSGTASYKVGEYFIEPYSYIEFKDGKLVATTVVGQMNEQERLSELGEGSAGNVARIYQNGEKLKETTVGQLDKQLQKLNKKQDWYYTREVANSSDKDKYIKAGSNGMNLSISFNGKTYGPYMMVNQMIVNNDNTKFYATVEPAIKDLEAQRAFLVSNDGKLKPFVFGGDLYANLTFSNGCVAVSPATAYASTMATEEDEAKQEALQKKMMEAMTEHPNELDVVFFDGTKLTGIYVLSPWMAQRGNNIFSVKSDSGPGFPRGLYLNGKNVADGRPQSGQAWSNGAGTNWAYAETSYGDESYNNLHLIFKDGTNVPGVIHPQQVFNGDKSYMVWFAYDRVASDAIICCSKEL